MMSPPDQRSGERLTLRSDEDLVPVGAGQLDVDRGDALFDARDGLRADDRDDPRGVREDPRERDG